MWPHCLVFVLSGDHWPERAREYVLIFSLVHHSVRAYTKRDSLLSCFATGIIHSQILLGSVDARWALLFSLVAVLHLLQCEVIPSESNQPPTSPVAIHFSVISAQPQHTANFVNTQRESLPILLTSARHRQYRKPPQLPLRSLVSALIYFSHT